MSTLVVSLIPSVNPKIALLNNNLSTLNKQGTYGVVFLTLFTLFFFPLIFEKNPWLEEGVVDEEIGWLGNWEKVKTEGEQVLHRSKHFETKIII